MYCRDLLTPAEFEKLSPITRDYIQRMAQVMNPKSKCSAHQPRVIR